MSTTYTTIVGLGQPATADRAWGDVCNANAALLDTLAPLGGLLVKVRETPSASLNVAVNAGTYRKADGTAGFFAGAASYPLPAGSTTYLWLTDSGLLTASAAYPTTAHVRLGHVTTGASAVTRVDDDRMGSAVCGTGLGFVLRTGDTMTGTLAVASPSTGTAAFVVNPSLPALAFFGRTPVSQPAAIATLTNSTNGVASGTMVDVGPTFSQSQVNANFASLTARLNAALTALHNLGLIG